MHTLGSGITDHDERLASHFYFSPSYAITSGFLPNNAAVRTSSVMCRPKHCFVQTHRLHPVCREDKVASDKQILRIAQSHEGIECFFREVIKWMLPGRLDLTLFVILVIFVSLWQTAGY